MFKWVAGSLVVLAVAGAAAFHYLVFRPQQQALETTRQQLADAEREKAAQKARIADLQSVRDHLERTSSQLHQQVAQKENELALLRSTQDELLDGLKQEIADRQIQVERIRDQIRVDMVDEILFDSGEATLKPGGVAVLKKVGTVLAKVKDRPITVQGHTDNVPIRGALAKRFPTNWELSSARATNVARFLQDHAAVDPTRLSATAFSEYRPRTSNETDEGRRANRRIEILLGSLITPEPAAETAAPTQPAATQPAQP
jgi:chemotaxis protein MotB